MLTTQQKNPIYCLSKEQTSELRELWHSVREHVAPERENFIRVKLGASQAYISRKQLFMVMSNLTEIKPRDPLPQWLYELDNQEITPKASE